MEKKKILIVDDDFSVRETLCDILRAEGYEVTEASSGADAIDKTASADFDCVIIDLRLPDIDGIKVIERMSDKISKNKIIVITGYASPELLSKTLTEAEYFLLLKPVEPEQLLAIVKKIIYGD